MKTALLLAMVITSAAHADSDRRTVTVTGSSDATPHVTPELSAQRIEEAKANAISEAQRACGTRVRQVAEFKIEPDVIIYVRLHEATATATFECEGSFQEPFQAAASRHVEAHGIAEEILELPEDADSLNPALLADSKKDLQADAEKQCRMPATLISGIDAKSETKFKFWNYYLYVYTHATFACSPK
jgi:hypothetical protein